MQTSKLDELLPLAQGRKGILAYKEVGIKKFNKFKKHQKWIDPSPYYLVWKGYQKGDIGEHKSPIKWPYQLKKINIDY